MRDIGFYTLGHTVQLSDRQRQQVDAIASLVTQTDQASTRQGIELAAALDDQLVFAALLDGVEAPLPVPKKRAPHRRYPSLTGGSLFDGIDGSLAWHGLACAHLLAASDLPLRHKVTSLALGASKSSAARSHPSMWLDGLERLTSLTHLDLLLSSLDEGMDLRALQRFPRLTHLRLRGPAVPGPLPTLEQLNVLDGVQFEFVPDTIFPALRSIRGRFATSVTLTPSIMPSLRDVDARGGLHTEGYESLGTLRCHHGQVELRGLQRVDMLSVVGATIDAPDLRHVGTLVGAGPGIDISRFETLEAVQFNRKSRFTGGEFPAETTLLNPKVNLWGPALTDLGNLGELPGLEILSMILVQAPISLETLRHAKELRVLDIRNSPGITDLSPLIGLPNLEFIVLRAADVLDVPAELADKVTHNWRDTRRSEPASGEIATD